MKVIASEDCPPDRVYINGASARLTNPRCEAREENGSTIVKITYDVEYEPIYCAVIRL